MYVVGRIRYSYHADKYYGNITKGHCFVATTWINGFVVNGSGYETMIRVIRTITRLTFDSVYMQRYTQHPTLHTHN